MERKEFTFKKWRYQCVYPRGAVVKTTWDRLLPAVPLVAEPGVGGGKQVVGAPTADLIITVYFDVGFFTFW